MLFVAHGEEELLARYLTTGIMTGGNYDFEPPRKKKHKGASLMTVQGEWSAYIMSDAYFAKTLADEKSQVWDHLINEFSSNLLAGTSVYVMGEKGSVATSEPGLR